MKVAVTAEQPQLDSAVDSRFGRCRFFILVDTDTEAWEAFENRDAVLSSGAGIAAAQRVVNLGVQAVVTGLVGPKATQVLNAAGVQIWSVPSRTVREALEDFKTGKGELGRQVITDPSGTSWGRGQGRGQGQGRGRGGCGRGMGRGMGGGMGSGRGRGNA
ncbi:MAG: NifB/NifX family molybdenum-iron cluster-binding protein [Syntrophobacteraceae bacterium]